MTEAGVPFDVLIFDEAAQIVEGLSLTVFQLQFQRLVLVGDPKQLSAVCCRRSPCGPTTRGA
jgi:superfamily I DNA and/or RNA helicase